MVTAAILAQKLFLKGAKPSSGFLTAVGRCLRELQRDGFACSVPHHRGLGWHLPGDRPKANLVENPLVPANPVVAVIPKTVRIARDVPRPGIQEKLLALLEAPSAVYTTAELTGLIEEECRLGVGEANEAVKMQLLALRQKRLIRPVDRKGEAGWCRTR